jgi:DNA-binding SARP family transcriptional activator/tetratricopeptide (TPR) repeat protein
MPGTSAGQEPPAGGDPGAQAVRFGVLGPLEVTASGRPVDLGGPRLRALVALLAAEVGRVVSVGALVEAFWGENPPADADRTVRTYVSLLRRTMREAGDPAVADLAVTRAPGYVLQVDPDAVDAVRFERLAAAGRRALREGQAKTAAERLTAAADLWRGAAYGEFAGIPALAAEGARLEQLRLAAVVDRVEADLALGLGDALVPELEGLTARYPAHERFWSQLMTALYRAGRQADALDVFRRARDAFVDELGLEPSPSLIEVHRQVLAQDPRLLASRAEAASPGTAAATVPNQLPAAPRFFTGREVETERLLEPTGDAHTLVVGAVDGMAGIGKTAVAVLVAHRLTDAGRYPDGTLFMDLHGFSGRAPVEPAVALETMLLALGVPGSQIPPDADARAALYRSVLARRRVLILLDNARDEAQVRPLLPGAPTCLVLVTSRRRLAGLDDADHFTLDTLAVDEAVRLFRAVAGRDRDLGDDATVEQIVARCGYLPLAVRIAAARLRASRAWTGPKLLERLRDAQDRLAELDDGERSVAGAFRLSYEQLRPELRRAFTLLGLHPGAEYEPYAVAALLDTTVTAAERALIGLEQVNLLDQPAPGRYRFHDLIRSYAVSTARELPDAQPARDRLYDHYAGATLAALQLAYPYQVSPAAPATPAGATPPLPDRTAARAWFDAELDNLVAAAHDAALHDRPRHTTEQAQALHPHLRTGGHHVPALALHERAVSAARAAGDARAEIAALNNLGDISRLQDRYDEALDSHSLALEAARGIDDPVGELTALSGLGEVHRLQGRYGPATDSHSEALRLAREVGYRLGELNALSGLGWLHYLQGRYGPATECHTEASRTAQAIGHQLGQLHALNGLGWVHRLQGRYGPAAENYGHALRIAREVGYRIGEVNALIGLGWVHRLQQAYGPAADSHGQALRLARENGDRHSELLALTGLGDVYMAQGGYGFAADVYQQLLDAAEDTDDRNYQLEGHLGLGRAHLATGRPELAISAHHRALTLARALEQRADQARVHDGLARAHRALGRGDRARRHWRDALDILTALDADSAEDITVADIRADLAALDRADISRLSS